MWLNKARAKGYLIAPSPPPALQLNKLPDEDATVLMPHRDGLLNNRRNRRLSDTPLLTVFRAKPGRY